MTSNISAAGQQQPQPKRDSDMHQQHAGGDDLQAQSQVQSQTGGGKPGREPATVARELTEAEGAGRSHSKGKSEG